jgi:CRP/FNR family transcriptional regulator
MLPEVLTELSAAGRTRAEARLTTRELRNGERLLHEGDPCRSLLFVDSGALRVFKTAESGREITLYRVRAGELCILSLSSLLARTPYTASVSADGATLARELDGETFRALYASEPALQAQVAQQLHRLLTEVMALVTEVAFRRVDERLAALLVRESAHGPVVQTTHERLAQHLGSAREVISRLLENLRDDGVLRVERGQLVVIDRGALESLVSG